MRQSLSPCACTAYIPKLLTRRLTLATLGLPTTPADSDLARCTRWAFGVGRRQWPSDARPCRLWPCTAPPLQSFPLSEQQPWAKDKAAAAESAWRALIACQTVPEQAHCLSCCDELTHAQNNACRYRSESHQGTRFKLFRFSDTLLGFWKNLHRHRLIKGRGIEWCNQN